MSLALRFVLALSATCFVLNLIWEYAQCGPFFVHGTIAPTHWAMVIATLGDVFITWSIYLVAAARRRQWLWPLHGWGTGDIWLVLGLSVAIALFVEFRALETGRWAYSSINPRVPWMRVSILPILQLILLVPLSIIVAARVSWRKGTKLDSP